MWWMVGAALATAPTVAEVFEAQIAAHPAGEVGVCGPVGPTKKSTWVVQTTPAQLVDEVVHQAGLGGDKVFPDGFLVWTQDATGVSVDVPIHADPKGIYIGKFDATWFDRSKRTPLGLGNTRPDPEWLDEAVEGGLRVSAGAPSETEPAAALPPEAYAGLAAGCIARSNAGPWLGYVADPSGNREIWREPPLDGPPHGVGTGPRIGPLPSRGFEAWAVPVLTDDPYHERALGWFEVPTWGSHFLNVASGGGDIADVWELAGHPDVLVAVGAAYGEIPVVLLRLPPTIPIPIGNTVALGDESGWYARGFDGGWLVASETEALLDRLKPSKKPWWEESAAKALFTVRHPYVGTPGFEGPRGRIELRGRYWVSVLEGMDATTR